MAKVKGSPRRHCKKTHSLLRVFLRLVDRLMYQKVKIAKEKDRTHVVFSQTMMKIGNNFQSNQ